MQALEQPGKYAVQLKLIYFYESILLCSVVYVICVDMFVFEGMSVNTIDMIRFRYLFCLHQANEICYC